VGLIMGGARGVSIYGGVETVTNSGTIEAGTDGVFVNLDGTVTNAGTIEGTGTGGGGIDLAGIGVFLPGGGTVIDSGTISGTNDAVYFQQGQTAAQGQLNSYLVLEAGYKLIGNVYAAANIGTTASLELSGSLRAVTVNYSGLLFGAGGNETLKATNTSGTLGTVTISGLTLTSDVVDLTRIGTNATLANGGTVSGNRLTVVGSGGTVTL
jgi:hypothetical protein